MSELLTSSDASDDGPEDRAHRQGSYRRPPRTDPLPDADQIQRMIFALNSAVILGRISPKVATIVHRNLRTLLDAQLRRDRQHGDTSDYDALIDLCRRDPSAIDAVEPFLSDAQLRSLMEEIGGGREDGTS